MSLTTMGAGGGARWFIGAAAAIDFANGWSLDGSAPSSLLTCTRASTAWAPNAAGVYTSFSSNVARTSAGIPLLTEEARTRLNVQPRNLGASGWVQGTNVSVALDAVGIDGASNSASTITISAADPASLYYVLATVTAATVYTFSFFAKAGTATGLRYAIYDATNAAFITSDVAYTPGDGVFSRVTATFTTPALCTSVRIYPLRSPLGTGTVIIDGVQIEAGAFVTSPILDSPTTTAARAADVVSLTTVPISGGTWTAFVDATSPDNSATRYFLAEASGNRVIYNSGSNVAASAFNGSAAVANGFGPTGGWATGGRAAVGASGAGRSVVFNNSAVGTDANTQTFPTTLYLGGVSSGALGAITIRRIALWSVRLPDPQLQALTA